MKKTGFKIVLLIIWLLPQLLIAHEKEGKYIKTKVYKELYQVETDGLLKINNEYGNINIMAWDQNQVSVTATVKVDGDDLDDVENQLNGINCKIEKTGENIYVKTEIQSLKKSSWNIFSLIFGGNNQVNFKINYEIKIPIGFDLNIQNDYGNIYIDKLQGQLTLHADYGKFEIGELLHDNNLINVDYFSKSSIDFIKGGKIIADYSRIIIDDAYRLAMTCDYSKIRINNIRKLKYSNDYGSIHVDNGKEIIGAGDYQTRYFSGVNLVDIKGDYGSLQIENILPDFDRIDLICDYVSIKINNNKQVPYQLEIKQEYGSFSHSDLHINKETKDVGYKHITGYYKDENTTSRIRIIEDYGSIKITN